jgi:AcrR family transcriptional regulator
MPTFVAALAHRWDSWLVDLLDGYLVEPHLGQRLEAISRTSSVVMGPGVRAMMGWAHTNPTIATAIPAPYRACLALSTTTVTEMIGDQDTGTVLGLMLIAMCLGFQQRPQPIDAAHFLHVVAHWYRAVGVDSHVQRLGNQMQIKVESWQRMQPVTTSPSPQGLQPADYHRPTIWNRTEDTPTGTKDRYFAAAAELLAERGSDGITVAALADRLDLTKGSFHHHFGVLPNFVDRLSVEFERAELARIDRCLAEHNPWRRMEQLCADLLVAPDPAGTAWRAWGQANQVVAAAVRNVDYHRERALNLTLSQILGTPDESLRAEMTLGLILGLHAWHPPLDAALIARVAIEWMRLIIGIDAEIHTDTGAPTLALRPI